MPDPQIFKDLKTCMKAAKGDPAKIADCQTAFTGAGGTATPDQGKVFSIADGTAAFVTNRGKVFGP